MPDYINVPIETEPADIAQIGKDYMAANIPGWTYRPTQLDGSLLDAGGYIVAESRDVASDVPVTIFRDFGANILGIQPIDEAPAYATSTWTMTDTLGHTIPKGTSVLLTTASGIDVLFNVEYDVIVPNGLGVTSVGEVSLAATGGTGSSGNSAGSTPKLVDTLTFVASIAIVNVGAGGEDAESDLEYLGRLVEEIRLMGPKPVLAQDFAVLAKRIPGVFRATYIDNYNLDTATAAQERCVTVIVTDELGGAVPAGVLSAADTYLESLRETNFLVFVGNATYNTINVTFTALALPGWDIVDVELRAEAAIRTYLTPLSWGLPNEENNSTAWVNKVAIRTQELYTVLNNVQGLDYASALTFQIGAGANDGTDKNMTGIAPLPQPGTINGTVVAP